MSTSARDAEKESPIRDHVRRLAKTELHLHIEGTLEPEQMIELSLRNEVKIPFASVEEARAAYRFDDLQSFLDVYYEGTRVLLNERDFFDLTWAYLQRAKADGIGHVEIFFDPQSHTERDVPFEHVVRGIHGALEEGRQSLGISSHLIACFLRNLSEDQALATLEDVLSYRGWIVGVGLDSSERGNPPERFKRVFERAREEGLHVVAHAGEEGPPDYIWQALDVLGAERIDHGVRALEDPALVERLVRDRVPLTVCPLSNVCLGVFDSLEQHNLKQLMEAGLVTTINSDDPAYFGGYLLDNFVAVHEALDLSLVELATLACNGIEAAFLSETERRNLLAG